MYNSSKKVICADNLTKQYKVINRREGGNKVKDFFFPNYNMINAVEKVSMDICEGEIVGFIGPNGAGKSTTIKMMTGVLEPTSGQITVNGLVPYRNRKNNAKYIGVVFGQRSQLWWDLPVMESFKILKDIYNIGNEQFERNLNTFNSIMNIEKLYCQPVRMLSLGQRMICDIFAAFLHDPKIVFLDEPTIGLDISVKEKVRDIIRLLNKEKGTTIILTSHDLIDIESLAQRLIIIDKGKIIYDGLLKDISTNFSEYRILRLEIFDDKRKVVQDISEKYGVNSCITSEGWIEIEIQPQKVDLIQLISYVSSKYAVRDLYVQDIKIEEIINKIYEGVVI